MSGLLLALIRGYQLVVSPYLPGRCRYIPSCSQYGYEAIQRHGAVHGSWLTIRRLLRCHPVGSRGYDPVPLTSRGKTRPEESTR